MQYFIHIHFSTCFATLLLYLNGIFVIPYCGSGRAFAHTTFNDTFETFFLYPVLFCVDCGNDKKTFDKTTFFCYLNTFQKWLNETKVILVPLLISVKWALVSVSVHICSEWIFTAAKYTFFAHCNTVLQVRNITFQYKHTLFRALILSVQHEKPVPKCLHVCLQAPAHPQASLPQPCPA